MQSRPLAGFLFSRIRQSIKSGSRIYKYLQAFHCAITDELITPIFSSQSRIGINRIPPL